MGYKFAPLKFGSEDMILSRYDIEAKEKQGMPPEECVGVCNTLVFICLVISSMA